MPDRKPSIVLLAVAAGMSPFAMAILLPALPVIVERFETDYAAAQFVVSAYLVGLGLSQLATGFLCDRFGRRPVVLTGYVVFVAASLACIFATSLAQLIVLRFLQAAGVSTGTVASRAIVRDIFEAEMGAKAMSYITIGLGTAPVIAPMLGGWLVASGGLRTVFAATALLAATMLLVLVFRLTETRNSAEARPEWSSWLANYARLLTSRPFLGFTLVYGFVQGSFFAFLAVGAGVFERDFDLDLTAFGVIWGAMAVAYVVGATLGGRLSVSSISEYLLPGAVLATPIGGAALYLLVLLAGVTPATVLTPMVCLMVLSGIITPIVMAGAVYQHPRIAGTAAGMSSALGLMIGSSFTVAAGFVYDGRFQPVAALMLATTCLTLGSWLLIPRVRASGPAPTHRR